MSSFTRTLQKRALKRLGYSRQTSKIEIINDMPQIVRLKKGEGNILDQHGNDTGSPHYPVLKPKAKAAPVAQAA